MSKGPGSQGRFYNSYLSRLFKVYKIFNHSFTVMENILEKIASNSWYMLYRFMQ